MNIREIRDFGAVYIMRYTYYDPKQVFFEVYTMDHKLIESFKTAKQAKKFCKRWILENIPHECY